MSEFQIRSLATGAPETRPANIAGMFAGMDVAGVIFDVDGTLVDSERDGHRVAFNRAFCELGLPDHWDEASYGPLLRITGGQPRLHAWFESRGMAKEERDQLVPRLHARKTELFRDLAAGGAVPDRPGVRRLLDELSRAGVMLGVATTGSRAWVQPLLEQLFGEGRFAVVVTAEEAPRLKPDPQAYHVALERMGTPAEAVVVVEDSVNGLRAAQAAGLPVAIVVNDYTAGQDFSGATLVLDSFGEPRRPARVIRGDPGPAFAGLLDLEVLRYLLTCQRGSS
jgi:HAD superfamily hydrolase (TIGR01509 family)